MTGTLAVIAGRGEAVLASAGQASGLLDAIRDVGWGRS
jgi:hypothetical protein